LDEQSECALLAQCEIEMLRKDLASFLEAKGFRCSTAIPAFQPFALDIWRALGALTADPHI